METNKDPSTVGEFCTTILAFQNELAFVARNATPDSWPTVLSDFEVRHGMEGELSHLTLDPPATLQ
jgi:hypothetical protein